MLNQSYRNIELIVVDDCSPDMSCEKIFSTILHETKSFPEFYGDVFGHAYCETKNRGMFGLIRHIVENIRPKGEIWGILEADDVYKPEKVEKTVEALINLNCEAVHTDVDFINYDGTIGHTDHWKVSGRYDNAGNRYPGIPQGSIYQELLRNNFIMTCSLMFRKEMIQYYDYTTFEKRGYKMGDYPWFLKMSRKHHIRFLDQSLSEYCVNPGSSSNNAEKRAAFVASTLEIQQDAREGRL